MKPETAQEDAARPEALAMLKAVRELRALRPPCWRFHHHGLASHIVTVDGSLHAVCGQCATALRVDQEIARQRETRAAMRRR
jgi:hypothetical protein